MEAIVVIQPRWYCGMDYFDTGDVVQVSDLTNAADVVVQSKTTVKLTYVHRIGDKLKPIKAFI